MHKWTNSINIPCYSTQTLKAKINKKRLNYVEMLFDVNIQKQTHITAYWKESNKFLKCELLCKWTSKVRKQMSFDKIHNRIVNISPCPEMYHISHDYNILPWDFKLFIYIKQLKLQKNSAPFSQHVHYDIDFLLQNKTNFHFHSLANCVTLIWHDT
jgi:hypothetical protein